MQTNQLINNNEEDGHYNSKPLINHKILRWEEKTIASKSKAHKIIFQKAFFKNNLYRF